MYSSNYSRLRKWRVASLFFCFGLWPLIAFSAANLDQGIEVDRLAIFAIANILLPLSVLAPLQYATRRAGKDRMYYLYPVLILGFYFFTDIMTALNDLGVTRFRYAVPIFAAGSGLMALADISQIVFVS